MIRKIKKILEKPIYVYLLGISYVVYKLSFDIYSFDVGIICLFLFAFLVGTALVQFIFKRVFRFAYSAPFVCICWLLFFFYYPIVGQIHALLGHNIVIKHKWIWILAIAVGLCFSYISFCAKRHNATINRFFNSFFLILLLIISADISKTYITAESRLRQQYQNYKEITGKQVRTKGKDIVWILMDEYTSSYYLKEKLNYNNPLDTFLQRRGFDLFQNIESRYDATLFSLNSIYNMDDTVSPYSFVYATHSLRHSVFPKILSSNGYRFKNISLFDIGGCNRIKTRIDYYHSLLFKLLEGTMGEFILVNWSATAFSDAKYLFKDLSIDYNDYVLQELKNNLQADTIRREPTFLYAHFLIPHVPYYTFDGNKKILRKIKNVDSIKTAYVDYVDLGNKMLMKLLDTHLLDGKVIIISGDHGIRYDFLGNVPPHLKFPFAAIYLPYEHDGTDLKSIKYISQLPAFLLQQ